MWSRRWSESRRATVDVDRTGSPAPAAAQLPPARADSASSCRNGIDLLVVEKRDVPIIAAGVYFPGGALLDPPELPGLRRLRRG